MADRTLRNFSLRYISSFNVIIYDFYAYTCALRQVSKAEFAQGT